jgi:hypothetical protein
VLEIFAHVCLQDDMNEEMKQLRSRRVDWLCWYLTKVLVDKVLHFQHVKQAGFKRNAAMEALVTASVRAAVDISDACVKLSEGDDAPAFVKSSASASIEYSVCGAGTAEASCTCVYFQRGNLCKHIIKVHINFEYQQSFCWSSCALVDAKISCLLCLLGSELHEATFFKITLLRMDCDFADR